MGSLPPITNDAQIIQVLNTWRNKLSGQLKKTTTPAIPWNFSLATKQGGNLISWTAVKGADGYELNISITGDFTDAQVINMPSGLQENYFDSAGVTGGATPTKRFYKIRATAGTNSQPQSVKGPFSGAVSGTAIAPNDIGTASSSSADTTTTDSSQTQAGRYHNYQQPDLP